MKSRKGFASLLLTLFFSIGSFANGADRAIQRKALFSSHKLGDIQLVRDKAKTFHILKGGKAKAINSYDVDPVLRKMDNKQLSKFVALNRIAVSKYNNGDYKLDAQGRLKGGGPILAGIGYWATKAVCYGVMYAGFKRAVRPSEDRSATAHTIDATVEVAGDVVADLGGRGAGHIANQIERSGHGEDAAIATTTGILAVAEGGGGLSVSGAIETLATGAWSWLMGLPTP